MKILAVGDIVGECGVKKLKEELPKIIEEEKIDFTIVNGENAASGMGITEKLFKEMLAAGADVVTMGNHTWGKKDIFNFIDHPSLIRPINYPKGVVGKGYMIKEKAGKKIAVINAMGRVDINILTENPFILLEETVKKLKQEENVNIIMIDFHAEATAEKIALGYYLDGKVSGIFGTHTHVATADETVLTNGTGYITDLGMTGPIHSVIGMDIDASIKRFVTALPERYKPVEGKAILNGCIFEINNDTCRTEKIRRITR
ncbi:MAG: TIGR00282 family metallophosphoesterase [Clostridia bacterium]